MAERLYTDADFDALNQLLPQLSRPQFDQDEQPGDIKYVDIDGDGLVDAFNSYREAFTKPGNKEVIFARTTTDYNEYYQGIQPRQWQAGAFMAATQKLVDAFYMEDGKDIHDSEIYSEEGFTTDPEAITLNRFALQLSTDIEHTLTQATIISSALGINETLTPGSDTYLLEREYSVPADFGVRECPITVSVRNDIDGDIGPNWESVKRLISENLYLSAYAGGGHYNDMDMLEIGRGLTRSQEEVHFGMWCVMSSPLLIGCDLTTVLQALLELLQNRELIAVNQDPLGLQAYVVQASREDYVLVKALERRHAEK